MKKLTYKGLEVTVAEEYHGWTTTMTGNLLLAVELSNWVHRSYATKAELMKDLKEGLEFLKRNF